MIEKQDAKLVLFIEFRNKFDIIEDYIIIYKNNIIFFKIN